MLLPGAVLLSACDFHGGVYRAYRLDAAPLPLCVTSTLGQVAGVTNPTYTQVKVNERPLHRFTYHAEGVKVYVEVEQESIRPQYAHHYLRFNTVPPAKLVARLRPVMAEVDRALEAQCGMRGLAQGVQESCPQGPFRSTDCAR